MIINAQVVSQAKQNGKKGPRYHANNRSMTTDDVVELLVQKTSPGAEQSARMLISEMARQAWTFEASQHSGGTGGDLTPHLRVDVSAPLGQPHRAYHLRLDARGCIFDVTFRAEDKTQRPSGIPPYTPPGA
jgi:hypothetical protein